MEADIGPRREEQDRKIARPAPRCRIFAGALDRVKVASAFERPRGRRVPRFFERAVDDGGNFEARDAPLRPFDLAELFPDPLEPVEERAASIEIEARFGDGGLEDLDRSFGVARWRMDYFWPSD